MAKLVLHGELGNKFGKEFNLAVDSPIEGVRALCALIPNFREEFQKGSYYVYLQDKDKINLDEESIKLKSNLPIHIVPAVEGAKEKGFGKLILGIAMIGVSFIPGLNAAVFGAIQGLAGSIAGGQGVLAAHAIASQVAPTLLQVGLMASLAGAAQMTAPKVGKTKESSLFNGVPDSVTEGTPVPIVYGEYLAIGYPVSFELVNGLNTYSGSNGNVNGGGASETTNAWTVINLLGL